MKDIKIFLKYIFDVNEFFKIIKDGLKQLVEIKSLSQLSLILSILMIVLIQLKKIENFNWITAIFFFLLFLYLKYLIVYRGGEHRRWYRDKQGIPAKKDLIREEFDLREVKGGENETSKIEES
jgi:hypothetical protein